MLRLGRASVPRLQAPVVSSATPSISSASDGLHKASLLGRRYFSDEDDDKVPKWSARYPKRYFDFKAFREGMAQTKRSLSEAELREVRRAYALPPPENWTVLTFLETMRFGEGIEDVANLFDRWEDFISMTKKDITRITEISNEQRRRLLRFITLYNHGLWPNPGPDVLQKNFGGKKLAREEEEWTQQEDAELLRLAKEYDASFGDPWIYLSWEMQRREDDIRDRYMEIVVKPREIASTCELAITKSSRPLLMNRKFRIMPMDLYVVPSEQHFRLKVLKEDEFKIPAAFKKYRQDDIF